MPTADGTILAALRAIADATDPLVARLATSDDARALFRDLGVEVPAVPPSVLELRPLALALRDAVVQLDAVLAGNSESSPAGIARIAALTAATSALFARAAALPGRFAADFAAFPEFLAEVNLDALARRLLDLLLMDLIASRAPATYAVLTTVGLFEADERVAEGDNGVPHVHRQIHYDRLVQLLSNPTALLSAAYGWGQVGFDARPLVERLRGVAISAGIPVGLFEPDESEPTLVAAGALASDRELRVVLARETSEAGALELGLALGPIAPTGNGADAGLALRLYGSANVDTTFDLSDQLVLELHGDGRLEDGLAVIARPPAQIAITSGSGAASRLSARLTWHASSGNHPVIFSQPDWFRLDWGGLEFNLSIGLAGGQQRLAFDLGLTNLEVRLQPDQADGFLHTILPRDGLRAGFDARIAWSSDGGITFKGSGGLELTIPLHISVAGAVTIDVISVALQLAAAGLEARVAMDIGASLGPIQIAVQRIGLDLALDLNTAGALGPADLVARFKPPSGLGLAIDAGPITGGGFIAFDPAIGRYAGALDLDLFGIAVTAIGVLDTRDSSGQPLPAPGFSFLMIISAQFQALQLGFGFTLNGVGGLVGIHRAMALERLRSGVRDGSLDHVMFPVDPIRNMPQIISDLSAFFPATARRFVFGPLAQIGWGTPTLFEAEFGLVLELPAPVTLALLGQINVALPTKDVDIVSLHIAILGVLDTGKKLLSIDASLYDSHVALFAVYGDMALRLSWGAEPNFALSIGGLNPHFQPPPEFPSLRRVRVALGLADNPRISLQGYFAVTSNSIQFGASAEIYAAAGPLNIYGWLKFDALVVFSPFYFCFEFSVGFALRWEESAFAGIALNGLLSGPSPFHIRGVATLSILFIDISIGFDITIGESRPVQLPAKDPWPVLAAAIADFHNWSASIEDNVRPAARFREQSDATLLLVHPMGAATLRQKILPLNSRLDKFGEFSIVGASRYDLSAVEVGAQAAAFAVVRDFFSPGQFQQLSNSEKLSRKSFEKMDAGVSVGGAAAAYGQATSARLASLEYETSIIDAREQPGRPVAGPAVSRDSQVAMSARGAKAYSTLRRSGLDRFADPQQRRKVRFDDESYAIASTVDGSLRSDLGSGLSKAIAFQLLDAHFAAHPEDRGYLQVVPLAEVASAA